MLPRNVPLIAVVASAANLFGQSQPNHLALADSLDAAVQTRDAHQEYRLAYLDNPTGYEERWKFARSYIDVAKMLGDRDSEVRDSLYWVAQLYAEAAIMADSNDAEGHFMLAQALGRVSLTKGGRDRVRYARQIYELAARALQLDPTHDGAHHVLGAWHAEIRRLSGLTRTLARAFLGAGFMGKASWDSAAVHLERAVELDPSSITHRLELGEIYIDMERWSDAREQLSAIAPLPIADPLDPADKNRARELLNDIRDR